MWNYNEWFSHIDILKFSKTLFEYEAMTLLGTQILQGPGLERTLWNKVDDLRAVDRLKLLHAHDALALLKNSLSMLRLLYILRISNCHNHSQLRKFDNTRRSGLS